MKVSPTLKELKSVIPQEAFVINEKRALLTLARTFSLIAIAFTFLYFTPLDLNFALVWILGTLLLSFSFLTLFIIGHECGHYSFSHSKHINDVVGFLSFILIFNTFHSWRAAHDFHHKKTQIKGVDPDWTELLVTDVEKIPWLQRVIIRVGLGSPIGLIGGFWVGLVKRSLFFILIPKMKMSLQKSIILVAQTLLSFSASFALATLAYRYLGGERFIFMYVIPLVGTAILGAFINIL